MGHPERAWPCLLVAGTNGKGSVCAYFAAALRASGLRTGLYTSPHLVRVNERIVVDGRRDPGARAAVAVRAVRDAAQRLVQRGSSRLTRPTSRSSPPPPAPTSGARTWTWPCSRSAWAGGSTRQAWSSRWPPPSSPSTTTTRPSWAGRWPRSRARRPACCARGARPCVGPLPAAARRAVEARARADRGPRRRGGARRARRRAPRPDHARGPLRGLQALPGRTSATTCWWPCACWRRRRGRARRRLRAPGRPRAARAGPGACSRFQAVPRLLLDGAHNPAGARALAAHLAQRPASCCCSARCRTRTCASWPRALRRGADVVLTRPRLPRAATPASSPARAGSAARARREPSVARALRLARRLARARGPGRVVVAGSLYLVGEVMATPSRPSLAVRRGVVSASRRPRAGAASRPASRPSPTPPGPPRAAGPGPRGRARTSPGSPSCGTRPRPRARRGPSARGA